jgi:hypothetical protein
VTQCTACPAGSTSARRSISSNSCQCAPGYTGPGGSSCTHYPDNTYKSGLGSGVCQSCPVPLTSPSGTDHIEKCSCMTGFEFNSQPQRCLVCSPNSHNEAGNVSRRCSCNSGFTRPDGGPSTACAAGKFKNFAGSASCVACTMSDSSPAPLTADRKACANCSSFGVFGTPSGYPPKLDTSRVQVLARLSGPAIAGSACVTGDNSTLSTQNDLDLGERIEIEYNCMVHDYSGFALIAAHRRENLLFAASIPMDRIFAISTDRKTSNVYRLTGGILQTRWAKTAGMPRMQIAGTWVQPPVSGFEGHSMVDGLRNHASVAPGPYCQSAKQKTSDTTVARPPPPPPPPPPAPAPKLSLSASLSHAHGRATSPSVRLATPRSKTPIHPDPNQPLQPPAPLHGLPLHFPPAHQ